MTGPAAGRAAVAVVGTGRMGAAMAGRIAAAGFPLTVYNRTRSRAESVAAEHRCAVADTARQAAAGADVVVVSLADDAAARATYTGEEGLVLGLRPGTVLADTSTISPGTVRELAARCAEVSAVLIDAPVSGSVSTVEAGGLTVMVGGDGPALETARPVLDAMAERVVHLGPSGAGAAMKLAVNGVVHALDIALSEALVLAERSGLDRTLAYDVFAHSAVAAPFVHYKRTAFLEPETTAVAFALGLVAKDLELADALAAEVGAPVAQLERNRTLVAAAIDAGFGEADLSAVAAYLRGLG